MYHGIFPDFPFLILYPAGRSQDEGSVRVAADFFTEERVLQLSNLMMETWLTLRETELGTWRESPEDFQVALAEERPDQDVRAAGERLFLALYEAKREILGPRLASLLADYPAQLHAASLSQSPPSPSLPPEIAFWDVVYLLLGLSSYSLREVVDLPAWYSHCFIPCLRTLLLPSPAAAAASSIPPFPPILLHRLLYLLACAPADAPPSLRGGEGGFYHLMVLAMDLGNPCTDLRAALQAVIALSGLLETPAFLEAEGANPTLSPFLPALLRHLLGLLGASEERESRSMALDLAVSLLGRMEDPALAAATVPILLESLPALRPCGGCIRLVES